MGHGFSIPQLIECAEREVKFRRRVYARRVEAVKMSQRKADLEIAMMEAIAAELQKLDPKLDL